ncbi:MAG: rhomboid family intramembrane serine protease [Elusimicrobiales bacterium]|jgi:membrane associated rhomboid family serine protease|nr:rhomboid family intramembrane serine protease [Elusimicrobiales bacterium]
MLLLGPSRFGALPPVTRFMLAACFGFWLAGLFVPHFINGWFGLVPAMVMKGELWRTLTYVFPHGGFWHLLFNCFLIWTLGGMMEAGMGSARYGRLLLYCSLAAAFLTVAVTPHSRIPVIGASGAVFGMLGAFAALNPDAVVRLYFLFPMSARALVILLAVVELAMSLSGSNPGIASTAHLGGLAAGWLIARPPLFAERLAAALRPAPRPARDPQAELDRLLDKISASGMESLSRRERETLERLSRERGGRA